uniref:Uncharacterized protein n=1 Tax=Nelumbo nucifera TaxID=4432 RepID=A0A822YG86_NELNU|nr:TPA_asm: hypothetical protein HUJ06_010358 [Nelumbo nucifera]
MVPILHWYARVVCFNAQGAKNSSTKIVSVVIVAHFMGKTENFSTPPRNLCRWNLN